MNSAKGFVLLSFFGRVVVVFTKVMVWEEKGWMETSFLDGGL